jgi:hypothetical protein
MANFTKEQWDEMSRKERKEAGLPVRPLDMWFAGSDAFKEKDDPMKEMPAQIKNTTDFIKDYNSSIVSFLREYGMTGQEDAEEFKVALAAWFSENAQRLDIPSVTSGTKLALIAEVYKMQLTNLNE